MLIAMAHVTFIHGIANKPEEVALLKLWRRGLAQGEGLDLSTERVSSSMVYWADLMYAEPLAEEAAQESLESVDALGADPVDMSWQVKEGGAEQAWAAQLEAKLEASLAAVEAGTAVAPSAPQAAEPALPRGGLTQEGLERIPLPWFVKGRLMDILLRDVHHYLFDVEFSPRPGPGTRIQEEIRRRFLIRLREGAEKPGPHVVVSHSMGTVIAYDCLKRVPDCPPVDALVTIGSPLGLDEIQDKLRPEHGGPGWSRDDGFPSERVGGGWLNVYDRFDPVAGLDPRFANDYRRGGEAVVRDVNEQNSGKWRHDAGKYLGGARLRGGLRELLGLRPAEE